VVYIECELDMEKPKNWFIYLAYRKILRKDFFKLFSYIYTLKYTMKILKRLITYLPLICLVWFLSSCAGGESDNLTTKISTKKEADTVKVSAKQLVDELESNEIRFMNNYKGKLLEVTGEISEFDTGFLEDELVINLDGGGGDFSFTSVDCNLQKNQNKIVSNYNKGDKITIKGKFDGEIMGSPLLKNCIIIK
tara:strand:- start:775 stop:1353 length:579 start_codon:yes stop_codon:yes gene_type:complete